MNLIKKSVLLFCLKVPNEWELSNASTVSFPLEGMPCESAPDSTMRYLLFGTTYYVLLIRLATVRYCMRTSDVTFIRTLVLLISLMFHCCLTNKGIGNCRKVSECMTSLSKSSPLLLFLSEALNSLVCCNCPSVMRPPPPLVFFGRHCVNYGLFIL